MTLSSRSAVRAAERRLEQSKRESVQHYRHARSALRALAGHPAFLPIVTGVGALLGIWFATRRRNTRVLQGRKPAPLRGTVAGWIVRAGIRYFAKTWARDRSARPHHSGA